MTAWPNDIREDDEVVLARAPGKSFTVIAVHADKAWVRRPGEGRGFIVPVVDCRPARPLH